MCPFSRQEGEKCNRITLIFHRHIASDSIHTHTLRKNLFSRGKYTTGRRLQSKFVQHSIGPLKLFPKFPNSCAYTHLNLSYLTFLDSIDGPTSTVWCVWASLDCAYRWMTRTESMGSPIVASDGKLWLIFRSVPGATTWSPKKVFGGQKSIKCTPGLRVV